MPVIDTYTIFGSWPSGGADLSLDRLKEALAGRDVKTAITHTTDSLFQTTGDTLATLRQQVASVPGLAPAAVIDPTLFVKPWLFAADIASQGYACVRFFPEVHKWPISPYSPFEKCLEALEPSGIPISIAITEPGQISALARIDLARTLPIILVHIPGECVSEVAAAVPGLDRWHVSTDGLTHLGLLEELVDVIGSERVLFGSSAPRGSIEGSLRYVKLSSLPDSAKEAILHLNAERLFGGRLAAH